MPSIVNAGGSLKSAFALLAAAWAARALGDALAAARRQRRAAADAAPLADPFGAASANTAVDAHGRPLGAGRYYARLSAEAVALLLVTQAVPHVIIDVRQQEEEEQAPSSSATTTTIARAAIRIPPTRLHEALADNASGWLDVLYDTGALDSHDPPTAAHTLVFVAASAADARAAASAAAALGFPLTAGVVVVAGAGSAAPKPTRTAEISTDALAVLLGRLSVAADADAPAPSTLPRVAGVIDVRTHEERALEGPGVPASVHVPAQEVASALRLALGRRPVVAARRKRSRRRQGGGGDDDNGAAPLSLADDDGAWRARYRCARPPLLAHALLMQKQQDGAGAAPLVVVFSASGVGGGGENEEAPDGRAAWCAQLAADLAAEVSGDHGSGAAAAPLPVFLAHSGGAAGWAALEGALAAREAAAEAGTEGGDPSPLPLLGDASAGVEELRALFGGGGGGGGGGG
jgi:hypothetical protein